MTVAPQAFFAPALSRGISFTLTLRSKIALMAALTAFSTALVVGVVNYARIVDLTRQQAAERLQAEAALIVPQVKVGFDQLRSDVLSISRTPPFQGLARTLPGNGPDPLDGSTTVQWRKRLETIFISILEHRPTYVQLRYIGVADGGRELVRVDRRGRGIEVTEWDDMQQKGDQSYILGAQDLAENGTYFSEITPNADRGLVDTKLPVIRAVTPVYGPGGTIFGYMVINAHAGHLLNSILMNVQTDHEVILMTSSGDYMVQPRRGQTSAFHYRDTTSSTASPIIHMLERSNSIDETLTRRYGDTDYVIHIRRVGYDTTNPRRFVKIAVVMPEEKFLAEASSVRHASLWTALLLVIVSSFAALAGARMISNPLKSIVDETRAFHSRKAAIDLPTARRDEIGELARAFTDLVERLDSARSTADSALARLKAMREKSADAHIAINESGNIVEFNKSAEVLFGYSAQEAIGRNFSDIVLDPPQDQHDASLSSHLEDGSDHVIGAVRTVRGQRKDGSVFPVELRVSEITHEGQRLFDSIVRDITERLEMEQRVAEYTTALERSNQNLDEFAYIASHDLKEPLRGIANHVTFLEEDYAEALGEDGQKRMSRLRELALRADKLTDDLLQWSRIGRATLEMEEIDLNVVVKDVLISLEDTIGEHDSQIIFDNTLPTVPGDRSRLTSVFMNLIVNGLKYNDSPQKRIEIGCRPGGSTPQGQRGPVVFVRDNGIGIAEEFHGAVFTIFKRLNHEQTYGSGNGAGLSFVKKIVERHGGEIWIDSKPGSGSAFSFTIQGASE